MKVEAEKRPPKCTCQEAHEIASKVGRAFAEDVNLINLARVIDLAREPLQAKIDKLMFEYCPEDMAAALEGAGLDADR